MCLFIDEHEVHGVEAEDLEIGQETFQRLQKLR